MTDDPAGGNADHDAAVQAVHQRLCARANELKSAICALEEAAEEIVELEAEIDSAWFGIEHGYDVEPRQFFEKQPHGPGQVFASPLQQAIHHIWKREPKVEELTAETARLRHLADELVESMRSEAMEREGQAEVYRTMRDWEHEEVSKGEARTLRKWAKRLAAITEPPHV